MLRCPDCLSDCVGVLHDCLDDVKLGRRGREAKNRNDIDFANLDF